MLRGEIENNGPALIVLPGVISAGTLLVAFTLMAVGFEHFWITFILGFGVILPTAMGLSPYVSRIRNWQIKSQTKSSRRIQDDDAALAALRRRYARGELSDAEFERRVERLLETESLDTRTPSTFDKK